MCASSIDKSTVSNPSNPNHQSGRRSKMLTLLHQDIPGKTSKLEVLLLLFPGFNTLDMNGPFDVLTKSGTSTSFNIQVASESADPCGITKSGEGVKVQVRIL